MKKLISRLMVALMAGAFTFAASANPERYDSYAAYGTITYNGEELHPTSGTGWLRDAIVLGQEGYDQTKLGGFKYEGAVIKATTNGVVRHSASGAYPHFYCDMTYDVRGCTVIGASDYNENKKIPNDYWIPTIYVTNHSGKTSMRVTVLADEKTRLGKFEFFPETGAQIVCDRPVPIIRAEPGTTNACDWANGVTDYGVAWYYADPAGYSHEPVFTNDGKYYYSQVKPVSLKGKTYDRIGIKTGDYDYTVPHTSFVVMENGKATPEWAGHEYYACTNECYGTTKKFQIAYRAHPTEGVYTTDPGYYFPDGTTNRTVTVDTSMDGVNDWDTFPGFLSCYIPAEQVTETPVPLISVASLDAPNATWTITGVQVKGKEGMVLSNGTYTVTYTADPGYYFSTNGTTETTVTLNTTGDEAKLDDGQKPGTPFLAVAQVNKRVYASVQAAFDATDDDIVTLVTNSTETVTLATNKFIGLDFNGHTLGKLVVTAGTVDIYFGTSGTLTSVQVSQPGMVRCPKNDVVAAPEGYEWFYDGKIYYTLVKTTEPYTGDVTIATNLTADATWVMTLDNANITVDKVAGTDTLASITNNLAGITGTGTILLNVNDKNYRKALRDLVAAGANVTIDCVTVSAESDGQGGLKAVVSKAAEDPEADTTLVATMKTEGGATLTIAEDTTKDVIVQDGITAAKNVTINNAGSLIQTSVKGDAISLTGDYGVLSNVTFDAKSITFAGENIISGPVTIKTTMFNALASTNLFSVENNNTTLDIDFDWIADSAAFGVIIDDKMASGIYPLATNAAATVGKTFTLMDAAYAPISSMTANATNTPVYNGTRYALVREGGALKLRVDASYVSNALEAVKMMAEAAEAAVAGMRFLQDDKDLANEQIWKYYYADTTGKVCTAQNTAKVDESVDDFATNLAGLIEYAKQNYEDQMPTDITIDATLESPDGKNTFKTLDAAFSVVSTSCATNLILKDRFTTLSENVPVDKTPDPATNYLQGITFQGDTGSGYLLIHENHVNTKSEYDAIALAAALQALVATNAEGNATLKVRTAARKCESSYDVLLEDLAAFESITLTDPTIAGDVELIAPKTTITGTLHWDVSSDVAMLHDFDQLTEVNADYAINVADVTATTGTVTRTLATQASKLAEQKFTFTLGEDPYAELTVGSESNVVYNSMVYTLAMTNETDLILTMDGGFVPEQLAAVDTAIAAAMTNLYAIGLSEEEVSYSTNRLATIREKAVADINAAKNKAEIAEALATEAGAIDAALETAQKLANASVRVAGTPYDTVAEAVEAAKAGDTVTLRKDVETDTTISVDKDLTLDLGTNTLSAAEGMLALDVTNATVWVTGQTGSAIATAHVALPGAVNCTDATSVQAPADYDWVAVPGEDYYTLAQMAEPFTGIVTIKEDITNDASWVMTLASNAVVTVDMLADTTTLASITNNLVAIEGMGTIILNGNDDAAKAYKETLEALCNGDGIVISCVTIVPEGDGTQETGEGNVKAVVDDKATEDGIASMLGIETNGTITVVVEDTARNDTVIAGELKSTKWDVVLVNDSEKTLTVPAVDAGKNVLITNVTEKSRIVTLGNVIAGNEVKIENNGHLEAKIRATDDITILNTAANTIVGEYKAGGDIYVTGEYGSLSNVTLEAAGTLTLTGTNIISGPVTLDAPGNISVMNSTLLFSIAGGNTTLCLVSDGALWRSRSMVTGVIIDDATPAGTYLLASNATEAVRKTFGLYKNGAKLRDLPAVNTNNLAIVDGVACGLTLEDNGELKAVVKIVADYTTSISNTAAGACADILAMTRLTDDEKTTATNAVMTICDNYVAAVLSATDTDGAEEDVVAAAQLIYLRCADAQKLGENKPYSITIDATAEENGTNVFNTLDAAFAPDNAFTRFATNLVIKGNVGLSKDTPAAPATNSLVTIEGEGFILVDWNRDYANLLANALNRKAVGYESGEQLVFATSAPTTAILTGGEVRSQTYAAESITLSGVNTISREVLLAAPAITNNGTLAWDISGDNQFATLANFDSITDGPSAAYAITLDADQADTTGGTITNYVIATSATSATNLTFTLTGPDSPDSFGTTNVVVGADNTLYLGAKAYSLVVDANSNLVFTIAWGKFAITYDAAGGTWTNEVTITNIDAYVNEGYAFPAENPTRKGYTFNGWYRSWTNNAENVTELDTAASPVEPLEAHALYAQWTRTAATVASLSDMITNDTPRVEITTADGFQGSRTLTELNMPLYVTNIGAKAFMGASSLKTINFVRPRSYADFSELPLEIGDYAFMGCSLEEIVIPAYVTKIGTRAFSGCNNLKKVTFLGTPSGMMDVKGQPFNLCGTKSGGLTISLAPAAATNTEFVAKLTEGCTDVIQLAQQLDGEISKTDFSKSFSETTDEVTLTITYTGTGIVNERSVSVLYGLTAEDLVKKPTYLVPASVVSNGDGTYTCVFKTGNVGAQSGFFKVCIGESF